MENEVLGGLSYRKENYYNETNIVYEQSREFIPFKIFSALFFIIRGLKTFLSPSFTAIIYSKTPILAKLRRGWTYIHMIT